MRARLPVAITIDLSSLCHTLLETKQLHALLLTTAYLSLSSSFATKLLRSYAAHGDILSARLLFDKTPHRTVYLWNSIIRAHAQRRLFSHASFLVAQMRRSDAEPDGRTFACVLRACSENSDPGGARMTHGLVISSGFASNLLVRSALVSGYCKLGIVCDARQLFDEFPEKDLVLWNIMISGYGYGGLWERGLEMFRRLREAGERPDGYSLVGLVSCFWDPSSLRFGRGIHGFCLKGGYDSIPHLASVLVSMYSRCKCPESSYQVFQVIFQPDLVTWSALITGFAQVGKCKEALAVFREMNDLGTKADPVLIASVLSACASIAAIGPGKEIHGHAFRIGIVLSITVSCALIDMYAKCGFAEMGFQVFHLMPQKNLVTYNTVMSALSSHGLGDEAIRVFEDLLHEGLQPDKASFSAVLCACCHLGLVYQAWNFFRRMEDEFGIEVQMEHYVYMVKLLSTVGQLKEAYDLIQTMPMMADSGVWGALLWGCSVHGHLNMGKIAAQRLSEMCPSKTAYKVMLSNIYASGEMWEDVKNLRDEMMEEGLQKSPGLSWIGDLRGNITDECQNILAAK